MANPRAADAGGRASGAHLVALGAHLVASGAPDFSLVKVANGSFVEGAYK